MIVRVNDVEIKSPTQLQEQIGRFSPGDKVKITVVRDNKEISLNTELKNSHGSMGVVSSEANTDVLGAEFQEVTSAQKDKYQIDYGVEVKSVNNGKFKDAGIKPGFIIVKINDQAIRSVDDLNEVVAEAQNSNDQFKSLNVAGLYPNGKIAVYGLSLAQ